LILLSSGVLFFFVLCGYLEESIIQSGYLPDFKSKKYLGWFLTFVELLAFSVIAIIERMFRGESVFHHRHPLFRHAIVGIAMTISRGLTNLSMQYLNYPTQVIFKSLKLLVVMLGGVILLRKSFHSLQYVAAVLFALSAMFFSLGDSDVSPDYNFTGIVIVCLSLLGDAVHSNTQEWLLKNTGGRNDSKTNSSLSTPQQSNESSSSTLLETMLFTNLFGAVCSLIVVFALGEYGDATLYCADNPASYPLFVIRSIVIYGGVLCLMSLFERFDAVVGTIVTTLRKVITIVSSFLLFPKPMAIQYLYGVMVFLIAVFAEVKARQKPLPKIVSVESHNESIQANGNGEAELASIVIRTNNNNANDEGTTPRRHVGSPGAA